MKRQGSTLSVTAPKQSKKREKKKGRHGAMAAAKSSMKGRKYLVKLLMCGRHEMEKWEEWEKNESGKQTASYSVSLSLSPP